MEQRHIDGNTSLPSGAVAALSVDEQDDDGLTESLFHSCMSTNELFSTTEAVEAKTAPICQDNQGVDSNGTDKGSQLELNSIENGKMAADEIYRTLPVVQYSEADVEFEAKRCEQRNHTSTMTSDVTSCRSAINATNSTDTNLRNMSQFPLKKSTQPATVNSINFNRDRTSLILSTSQGVRIITLHSLHYSFLHDNDRISRNDATTNSSWMVDLRLKGGATYAQLLQTTSLLAVVQPSFPRCCFLYNARNATNTLAALPMSAAVKRIELTRKVLVCLTVDGRLHLFHMSDADSTNNNSKNIIVKPVWMQTMNIMHPSDTVRNLSRGMNALYSGCYFDLSPNEERPYLVCKSSDRTMGTIRVYDPCRVTEMEFDGRIDGNVENRKRENTTVSINNSGDVSPPTGSSCIENCSFSAFDEIGRRKIRRRCHLYTTIDAHEHPVTRMLIGDDGSRSTSLATASSKGTIIRVFALPHGELLWEWHRGSRSCQIYCLSWNGMADRLVSYGTSGTIHVFDCGALQIKKQHPNLLSNIERSNDYIRDFDEGYETIDEDHTAEAVDALNLTEKKFGKTLYRRIESSIRRHTVERNKKTATLTHRSFAKLKYESTKSNDAKKLPQYITLAFVDRHCGNRDIENIILDSSREDAIVLCSIDGELRQYSVAANGCVRLVRIENVLFRDTNVS